jgi:aminoglycoside phosphotransferase (APT) family kinase protein
VDAIAFDPADLIAIRERLGDFLGKCFGNARITEGLERFAGGLDTHVYGMTLTGELPDGWPAGVVLRVYPTAEQDAKMEREFAVQEFASERGFPAPKPLFAGKAGELWELPFMLMERAPGTQAVDGFKNPLRIRGMIRAMADLQARLHSLPTAGCPLPYDRPLMDRLLDEPRRLLEKYPAEEPMRGLLWLEENAAIVRDEEPVLVHNDFHPINIVAKGDQLTLLDWSDAALGDRHSDVARTLGVFWLAPSLERSWLGRTALSSLRGFIVSKYMSDYASHAALDPKRLRYWEAMHAFCEWVTVDTMDREGVAAVGAREGLIAELRGLAPRLQRYFEERAV